jgi:decaprenylphospho-beta-D-ribofuranose 2-oxidase
MKSDQPETLSFGRYARGTSIVLVPNSRQEVVDAFAAAAASKPTQRVVIHGGGHAFDGQAVHHKDNGRFLLLSTENFKKIEFLPNGTVCLGGGATWMEFLTESMRQSANGAPIRLPGSMQTGRKATVAGTLAGDCLSRFSGTMGRESAWVEAFSIVTPDGTYHPDVRRTNDPDLFNAVIGGLGYLGFVTEAVYRLVEIPIDSVAQTAITTFPLDNTPNGDRDVLRAVLQAQIDIINQHRHSPRALEPRAVSSALYTTLGGKLRGGVFNSVYVSPGPEPRPNPFPLYENTKGFFRELIEEISHLHVANLLVHDVLFKMAKDQKLFQNDVENFLFFMDGNTTAKETVEARDHTLYPILQQTWIIPVVDGSIDNAVQFAEECLTRSRTTILKPMEFDILFCSADESWMSGNFAMDGFAISLAYEPRPQQDLPYSPRLEIANLFKTLSRSALGFGGRIHLVKNVIADKADFREMFSAKIGQFEEIKRHYDPALILQNKFSHDHFEFALPGRRRARHPK